MKELKKVALNFILEHIEGNGRLTNVFEYQDYFDVIKGLISIDNLSEVKRILVYLSKSQNWKGSFEFEKLQDDLGIYTPILFLNSLAKYLLKVNDVEELKYFKRILKKSIFSLRDYFDEDYLLFFKKDFRNRKKFTLIENVHFLSICSEFSDFLNHHDYTNLADELFMLKGKIELGFERYFFQKDFVVEMFSPEEEYFQGTHETYLREMYNEFPFDYPTSKKILFTLKKEKDFDKHFYLRLHYYLFLKNTQQDYKKYLKKDLRFLLELPITFVPKEFIGEIEKSLFHKEVNIIKTKGKSDNLLIRPIFRLRVASLILMLVD